MTAAATARQVLAVVVGAFVDELVRSGVRHFCVCPGSRSTPLALAIAEHPGARLWLHLDERSAAFFGLGLGRASREPAALVCTSGTAAANFMPAVVEAYHSRVPLIVLTADRPHELRDNGAPQTIDQVRLYGSHARWFFDLAEPSLQPELVRHVRTIACRAVATARGSPAGPVHVNCPYREPLIPQPLMVSQSNHGPSTSSGGTLSNHGPSTSSEPALSAAKGRADQAAANPLVVSPSSFGKLTMSSGGTLSNHGRPDGRPYVAVSSGPRAPEPDLVAALAEDLAAARRGLIVGGPPADEGLAEPLVALAGALGYPILADPLSGLRCGPHARSLVLDCYDAVLRDAEFVERAEPEVVLRFGAMPTSKPVLLYLERYAGCRQIVVDGEAGWNEPTSLASDVVQADGRLLCQALLAGLPEVCRTERQAGAWARTWVAADRAARAAIATRLAQRDELFEGQVFAELAALLPDGATLYAGNSMPIRDLDTFFPGSERRLTLLANRGANGIDGVVSSALGASAAGDGPLVLVIGDLSFYHDSNGLLAARRYGLDAVIVLLNNDGGGIFSFLPQVSEIPAERFELLFGTPHGLDFRPLAAAYGATFSRVASWGEFRAAVRRGLGEGGLHVVEVPTERERNVALHRELWPLVAAALQDLAPAAERA